MLLQLLPDQLRRCKAPAERYANSGLTYSRPHVHADVSWSRYSSEADAAWRHRPSPFPASGLLLRPKYASLVQTSYPATEDHEGSRKHRSVVAVHRRFLLPQNSSHHSVSHPDQNNRPTSIRLTMLR